MAYPRLVLGTAAEVLSGPLEQAHRTRLSIVMCVTGARYPDILQSNPSHWRFHNVGGKIDFSHNATTLSTPPTTTSSSWMCNSFEFARNVVCYFNANRWCTSSEELEFVLNSHPATAPYRCCGDVDAIIITLQKGESSKSADCDIPGACLLVNEYPHDVDGHCDTVLESGCTQSLLDLPLRQL